MVKILNEILQLALCIEKVAFFIGNIPFLDLYIIAIIKYTEPMNDFLIFVFTLHNYISLFEDLNIK